MNSRTVWTLDAVSHIEIRIFPILTKFWPVLGPIWCWIKKKILEHNVVSFDLSWSIYISQKKMNQAMLKYLEMQYLSIVA